MYILDFSHLIWHSRQSDSVIYHRHKNRKNKQILLRNTFLNCGLLYQQSVISINVKLNVMGKKTQKSDHCQTGISILPIFSTADGDTQICFNSETCLILHRMKTNSGWIMSIIISFIININILSTITVNINILFGESEQLIIRSQYAKTNLTALLLFVNKH